MKNVGNMSFSQELLGLVYDTTLSFVNSVSKKDRKKYGQFFTSRKIAESPDHMIHLNGDKFLGPR